MLLRRLLLRLLFIDSREGLGEGFPPNDWRGVVVPGRCMFMGERLDDESLEPRRHLDTAIKFSPSRGVSSFSSSCIMKSSASSGNTLFRLSKGP
jgi:hypothetical protein